MARRLALAAIFVALLLIGAAYGTAFIPAVPTAIGAWLMVIGVALIMVGFLALGALQGEPAPGLRIVFGLVFLILLISFGAALLLPEEDPASPALWFGLPSRAAVIIYGVGILPLFILPLAYALTFRDPEPLSTILEAARRHSRSSHEPPSGDEVRGVPAGVEAAGGAGESTREEP